MWPPHPRTMLPLPTTTAANGSGFQFSPPPLPPYAAFPGSTQAHPYGQPVHFDPDNGDMDGDDGDNESMRPSIAPEAVSATDTTDDPNSTRRRRAPRRNRRPDRLTHNEEERKRRIKHREMQDQLRDVIPDLVGLKPTSAELLRRARAYILELQEQLRALPPVMEVLPVATSLMIPAAHRGGGVHQAPLPKQKEEEQQPGDTIEPSGLGPSGRFEVEGQATAPSGGIWDCHGPLLHRPPDSQWDMDPPPPIVYRAGDGVPSLDPGYDPLAHLDPLMLLPSLFSSTFPLPTATFATIAEAAAPSGTFLPPPPPHRLFATNPSPPSAAVADPPARNKPRLLMPQQQQQQQPPHVPRAYGARATSGLATPSAETDAAAIVVPSQPLALRHAWAATLPAQMIVPPLDPSSFRSAVVPADPTHISSSLSFPFPPRLPPGPSTWIRHDTTAAAAAAIPAWTGRDGTGSNPSAYMAGQQQQQPLLSAAAELSSVPTFCDTGCGFSVYMPIP
ncbi:hypothetical protein BC828DRAFT_389718 [Blastocladiella britannica]|nr:hypothetical protein BC828DRAFT_389718 [Blastocladiella britannica]